MNRLDLRAERSFTIQLASAFDDLADHVRSVVASGGSPDLEDCVAVLDTSGDDM
ncbi:hypothetical protein [Lentzea sp. NPDC055074]